MSKIIIGIHGLKNKPPKRLLKRWWKKSIREGLNSAGHPSTCFRFDLVYWADILHPDPLNPKIKDAKDPLFLSAPYRPSEGNPEKKPSSLRKKMLDILEDQMDKLFLNEDLSINFSGITDMIIHRFFTDLEAYYSPKTLTVNHKKQLIKDIIRRRLLKKLKKYKGKDILLIGHSMGSIIAYDVLLEKPNLTVDTLITIGSPLGIPVIISRIVQEQKLKVKGTKKDLPVRTPEGIIKAWFNFSDLEDKVAINYNLADDYAANSKHVKVMDTVVSNDYQIRKERNPHKSYGYLRTPEVTKAVSSFLNNSKKAQTGFIQRWIKKIS